MFKEAELSKNLIGIAMRVHNQLGPGFKENIYHQATIAAIKKGGHDVETEKSFTVYLDKEKVGTFRVDLIIDQTIIIEIKAVGGKMPAIFHSQLVSYLKASKLEVGLLINFGNPSLEFKRIAHYYNLSKSSI